jgi:hypothetical protein
MWEQWHLEKFYTGALITDAHGAQWIYLSAEANPCQAFPRGAEVKKAAYYVCCDTGDWGKCVFGGRYLEDIGAAPINSFQ